MSETRTVFIRKGKQAFHLTIPTEAKITYGPWSPPSMRNMYGGPGQAAGTLRVYKTEKNILGIFPGVTEFRDLCLELVEVDPSMLEGMEDEDDEFEEISSGIDAAMLVAKPKKIITK